MSYCESIDNNSNDINDKKDTSNNNYSSRKKNKANENNQAAAAEPNRLCDNGNSAIAVEQHGTRGASC